MNFWIIAAALLALALVILQLPLMRGRRQTADNQRTQQNIQIAREQKRQLDAQLAAGEIDQAAFDAAYLDLQTALALELDGDENDSDLARGKWMAWPLLVLIPVASVSLYLHLGEYRVIENPELVRATPHGTSAEAPQMSLEEMETRIRERLRDNPEDAEGWFMLGRTYMAQQQYDKAVTAYQRSNDLIANEPGIIFALADALAMKNNGNLVGEPEALVQRGLELAPRFPNGLWLAGLAAEQRQDYEAAHGYWSTLLPLIQDNPQSASEVSNLLAMLEQRDPSLASKASVASSAGAGGSLNVSVDISAELKAKAAPNTAVFVYAKAMQGPPMPLAVKKMQLGDLPAEVKLGDGDAMMPSMKLSGFDQVIVGARVSFSGNPVAQSGDFFTEVDSINSADPPPQISLTIDRIK